jgi:hypothetical protein
LGRGDPGRRQPRLSAHENQALQRLELRGAS